MGIPSLGVEANPVAHFASRTKVDWNSDPGELAKYTARISRAATRLLEESGISDEVFFHNVAAESCLRRLQSEQEELLLANSISPLPLHKVLILLEAIERQPDCGFRDHARLALAKVLVAAASNLQFGPEVGVGKAKDDAAVIAPWREGMRVVGEDLKTLGDGMQISAEVFLADSRNIAATVPPASVDFVFTSPPYPNEKDYTRTTRLESVVLGFIKNKTELRRMKQNLIRSNTRNVYKLDDDQLRIGKCPNVWKVAAEIEQRRQDLGKTSGFERLYSRVTQLYFGGMARHLEQLKLILKPGAYLAYVVGDQASYFRVLIRTGQLLAEVAESLGFEVLGIDLFRTRLATATREQLREEVVLLQWKGT
ncbi:MAG: site-specific DNA-methyltransferase [Candidatus Hydrogenedentes bacterium]|nr:site-specific DNA-methyltransferase [Candidatus Hydrogenedentota bacterium]